MIVLGSQSPRRYELLAALVGESQILVRAPRDETEAGFDDVTTIDEVTARLTEIARTKNVDVSDQLQQDTSLLQNAHQNAILTADTVIVGFDPHERPVVLGKPPEEGDRGQEIVRGWFKDYLLRAPHLAMTALCLTNRAGIRWEQVATSQVTFRPEAADWVDWYLQTGESIGKAGGYGLQGAGSLFVERIDGSPSNVIGLPLLETAQLLRQMNLLKAPYSGKINSLQ